MHYILCYKGKWLGNPMPEKEALELYEEMLHCFESLELIKLTDKELRQLNLEQNRSDSGPDPAFSE